MSIYEIILDIIGKKGPATIPSILEDMKESATFQESQEKPIQISQIRAAISRKKDLFAVEDNLVSILPERELVALSVSINHFHLTQRISIDFLQNTFQFYEWFFDKNSQPQEGTVKHIGSIDQFKSEIYRLKLWNWEEDYQSETFQIGGTSWDLKLETKAGSLVRKGYEKYPKEWRKFCKALSKLTGAKIE